MNSLIKNNKNRASQDWLGLSIIFSLAIFAAFFVLGQSSSFIQDTAQQQSITQAQLPGLH